MSEEKTTEGQDQDSISADPEPTVPQPYGMPGGGVDDSFSSAARLLDAIDKQNKRLNEIRDAVANIDWSSIRLAGLGLGISGGATWTRSWDAGDAQEG
jgi:hypothetical protein